MEVKYITSQELDQYIKQAHEMRAREIQKFSAHIGRGLRSVFTLSFLRSKKVA